MSLQGDLLDYVRRRAAAEQRTMASVIEDALKRDRALAESPTKKRVTRLPVFGGRGVRPGVNLDSASELLDRMEGRL